MYDVKVVRRTTDPEKFFSHEDFIKPIKGILNTIFNIIGLFAEEKSNIYAVYKGLQAEEDVQQEEGKPAA